jgi:hypothetical protein
MAVEVLLLEVLLLESGAPPDNFDSPLTAWR